MPLPKHLEKLTAAAWREAKKEAGVGGAGFFDGTAAKGVADKIDDYQAKHKAFESKDDAASAEACVKSIQALTKALTVAKNDRTFKTFLAKEFKAAIESLLEDLEEAEHKAVSRVAEGQKGKAADPRKVSDKGAMLDARKQELVKAMSAINNVKDIRKSPKLWQEFDEYAEFQHARENTLFLTAVAKHTDANAINKLFLDKKSKFFVNLGDQALDEAQAGDYSRAEAEIIDGLSDYVKPFKEYMVKKHAA